MNEIRGMRSPVKLFFLVLLLLLSVWAPSLNAQTEEEQEPVLYLNHTDASITTLLNDIEKQSGYFFSYESSLLTDITPVTFQVNKLPLRKALEQLLNPLNLSYRINGQMVILKKKVRKVTISGFVSDKVTSESLIGASIYLPSFPKGTTTNNHGFFSITLEPGDINLQVSYTGYQPHSYTFSSLHKDTLLTVGLVSNNALEEVLIVANDNEQHPVLSTQMGTVSLDQQTIKSAPVMFGEADIIKALQLTPGVSTGTEGLAGLYVRGGNMDENLFQIDGNPVYQVSHLGGVFSAFNPEALRGIEFYKAGFPARYGGRLSSVVDVHTKEGNMNKFRGSISIGLLSGNLNLEGPIIKDRTSFAVSLRRSWLEIVSVPAIAIINKLSDKQFEEKHRFRYAFHDLNLRLDHKFNERSRMYFSLYNGKDHLNKGEDNPPREMTLSSYTDRTDAYLDWGNLMATTGWTYMYNNRLFGRLSGVFTQYRSSTKKEQETYSETQDPIAKNDFYSESKSVTSIMDMGIRSSFDYLPAISHHIRFGSDLLLHRFRPEYRRLKTSGLREEKTGLVWSNTEEISWTRELSLFIEDDWTISSSFRVNGGLRYTLFDVKGKTYMSLEPRFSLRQLISENLSTKLSYARMNQHIHMVSESYISLPTDAWMPVTRKLKPLKSDQLSLGFYYTLGKEYVFSVEGYYKKLDNLLEYKEGYSSLSQTIPLDEKMTLGKGRAYGIEFMAHKQTGKTTGWISYTLSKADRLFDEINNGKRFPSKYDNRHKLNIFVSHKLSPKVELSAAWTFSSGNWQTLSLENFESPFIVDNWGDQYPAQYMDLDFYAPGTRNNYQLPNYHRLDLGLNLYRPKKSGRLGIWTISIYNAYCQMNPFTVYKVYTHTYHNDPTQYKPVFRQLSLIPLIPSVSYTYKF